MGHDTRCSSNSHGRSRLAGGGPLHALVTNNKVSNVCLGGDGVANIKLVCQAIADALNLPRLRLSLARMCLRPPVTEGLIQRKMVLKWGGGRGLKKRAKREYLRCLQMMGGPNQRTVCRVIKIGVMIKSAEETQKTLLQPYQKKASIVPSIA